MRNLDSEFRMKLKENMTEPIRAGIRSDIGVVSHMRIYVYFYYHLSDNIESCITTIRQRKRSYRIRVIL